MPPIPLETFGTNAMKLLVKNAVNGIASRPDGDGASIVFFSCLNGGVSVILVLLGGLFAGLTLAFMGQDKIFLQVIARSGTRQERENAQKVLNVIQRGRHWVLVSLLLGNVIVNETLPIVLDQDVKGGWFAVLASTVLIVIFGEIIPQSICAKHGLAIGAWSSRYVLCVMYALFPVAYPIAKLLDRLLGADHGIIFNRAGLKALIAIHEHLGYASIDGLTREEVTVMSSIIDSNTVSITEIMTPTFKVYTLSLNQVIDETTRYNILKSGYSGIPVCMNAQVGAGKSFVGVLPVKSLVALNTEATVTVGQLSLDSLPVVRPNASIQDVFQVFRDRSIQMVLVTERGLAQGEPLGILTARDVMEEMLGNSIVFKEAEGGSCDV